MTQYRDTLLTAIAPLFWGTTYLVTTQLLPPDRPFFLALMRALPVGMVLLLITRELPKGIWIWRSALLGIANFTAFFPLLFLAAYRLPGGVAAMLGALSPLIVLCLARWMLGTRVQLIAVLMGFLGVFGVSLVVLRANAQLDTIGILAALCATTMMATATVLIKKWGLPTSPLNFTAWQLTAGGLLLVPITLLLEGLPNTLTLQHWLGFAYLDVVNTGLSYYFWFRGIGKLAPTIPPFLSLLSPVVAVLLGWMVLQQALSLWQVLGVVLILCAIVGVQFVNTSKSEIVLKQVA